MIEFSGYIDGSAEKFFWQNASKLGRNIMIISLLLLSPAVISIAVMEQIWIVLFLYVIMFIMLPLLAYIPKGKKEKHIMTPNKIIVDENYIVCTAIKYSESRLISDVKSVIDYGDFYYVKFPPGKISEKFICQKSLLSSGTLREFEMKFEGKIIRR